MTGLELFLLSIVALALVLSITLTSPISGTSTALYVSGRQSRSLGPPARSQVQRSPQYAPDSWSLVRARNMVDRLLATLGQGGTLDRISQHDWFSMWNNQTANLVTRDDSVQLRCYVPLGCVEYSPRWYHAVYRPVNMFPLERHIINTTFFVYNRHFPLGNLTLTAGDTVRLIDAKINCKKMTKFIIHGFLDTGEDVWVKEMASHLLLADDVTVFAVDWRTGALPMYQQAVANIRLVAMEISLLITWLQHDHGLDLLNVHLIGHSLGAHTAGYVGASLSGTIGRISGLDPAQPGFQYLDPVVHLDRTDAKFVDVIHTDGRRLISGGFGMMVPCGHLDFYPNGGIDQPGCSSYSDTLSYLLAGSVDDAEAELFACRHVKSIRFYSQSLIQQQQQQQQQHAGDCQFLAHACTSYQEYLQGKCTDCGVSSEKCAPMGYYSDRTGWSANTSLKLFTTTSAQKPFCLHHYMLVIEVDDSVSTPETVTGRLSVSLFGTKNILQRHPLSADQEITLHRGTNHSLMVETPVFLGRVHASHVYWRQGRGLPCLLWCSQRWLILKRVILIDMSGASRDPSRTLVMSPPERVAVIKPLSSPAVFTSIDRTLTE